MSDAHILLSSLNPPQHQAVITSAQHALILAGAGSGKTKVLVHRMAWLLVQGVSPNALLAVTFTNKAAEEMRERIEAITQLPTHRIWLGTFHGLCHRMLRQYTHEAGLSPHFQILDARDQLRLIKRLLKEARLDEKQVPPHSAAYFINMQKEAGIRSHRVTLEKHTYKEQALVSLYGAYERTCEKSELVDFTELLLRTLELLEKNPLVCQHLQSRFHHLLVDEFQDTNTLQYRWLKCLAGKENNLFAVGDDDQSIYGWRGANIENIVKFNRDFPHAEIIRLEQNYRSTKVILSAANALIRKNTARLGKTLWTLQNQGSPIRFYQAFNETDEARFIAEAIQSLHREGHSYNDMSVLYRSNAQSRILEQTFTECSIPYSVRGGLQFFARAEIKDVLGYLQLIVNRHNDSGFLRVVNVPSRQIGDKTLNTLQIFAKENSCSLWQATRSTLEQSRWSPRTHMALSEFINFIDALDKNIVELSLSLQIQTVIHRTALVAYYQNAEPGEKGRMRADNLNELIYASSTKRFSDKNHSLSPLAHFLSEVALQSETQDLESESPKKEAVHLMTVHAAKGLEFAFVFVSGLEDRLFPHAKSLEDPRLLEEERRLCYVALTRAKQRLFLTCSTKRWFAGKTIEARPSQFLFEIPFELFERAPIHTLRHAYAPITG
ncbi:MAG: UvrD-helicase domain-containing protein [Gammaproteobacteria bacterium]|nr:UvrD-helicase domain-containing protein [Gammaproteobacteria bacterium]